MALCSTMVMTINQHQASVLGTCAAPDDIGTPWKFPVLVQHHGHDFQIIYQCQCFSLGTCTAPHDNGPSFIWALVQHLMTTWSFMALVHTMVVTFILIHQCQCFSLGTCAAPHDNMKFHGTCAAPWSWLWYLHSIIDTMCQVDVHGELGWGLDLVLWLVVLWFGKSIVVLCKYNSSDSSAVKVLEGFAQVQLCHCVAKVQHHLWQWKVFAIECWAGATAAMWSLGEQGTIDLQ